jgi:hypothetical protein
MHAPSRVQRPEKIKPDPPDRSLIYHYLASWEEVEPGIYKAICGLTVGKKPVPRNAECCVVCREIIRSRRRS